MVQRFLKTVVPVLLLLIAAAGGGTTMSAPLSTEQRADSLFAAGNYAEAASAYREAAEERPDRGRLWFQYGLSAHYVAAYDEAINAYRRAVLLGIGQSTTQYNIACAYALKGNPDAAFAWLDTAVAVGLNNVTLVEQDHDLDDLRSDSRWLPLLQKIRQAASPCESDPNCRQLDFWIGDWDVYGPDGSLVGRDVIRRTLNGCLVFQQWQSGFGNEGKSMRFWDPVSGRWKMTWVDAQGGVVSGDGELIDGAMHFACVRADIKGTAILERAILQPLKDGRVRHFIEQSIDNGRTWYVYFEGFYVKDSTDTASFGQP